MKLFDEKMTKVAKGKILETKLLQRPATPFGRPGES